MKIFVIPTSYPDEINRTKNIFIYEQAKALAEKNHEIVVLHVQKQPTKKIFSKIEHSIQKFDDGFATRYVIKQKTFMEDKFPWINKHLFIYNMRKLYDYAVSHENKPDVLYAHFSIWAGYAGKVLAKKYNIPLVTMEHYSGFMGQMKHSQKIGLKKVIEASNIFLCVSTGLKQSIQKQIGNFKDIYVVSNLIDKRFQYVAPDDTGEFVISSIGGLSKRKGFELLIKAFCKAFKEDDKIKLRIAGNGPEYYALKKIIEANKRKHQIILLGNITREETLSEYINCNCFVLPSKSETFGIVYREALATGRPIITTNHGGFSSENWHDEYGYMISVDDMEGLIEKLKKLRKNYNNFDFKEISKLCLADCSTDIVIKQIEDYLKKACKYKN